MDEEDNCDPSSACAYQSVGLLPEIHIDTSRLDVLLSSVQKRLTNLENSFAKVAESAAEAAHKVHNAIPKYVAYCCHYSFSWVGVS